MTDEPFDDDELFNNGASGSGLDDFENHHILIVPHEWTKGGYTDSVGKSIDVVDATIYDFSEDEPVATEGVRIFAGKLVGSCKRGALFNMTGAVNPKTSLPAMTIGKLYKGPKQSGKTQPWELDKIDKLGKEKEVFERMKAYAYANLRAKDPFSD